MTKWNLIIDVELCHNCNNCIMATKDEYTGNTFTGYSAPQKAHGGDVMRIRRRNRGAAPMVDIAYLPVMCNHCDQAPCIAAAGDSSIRKRADGIVIFDPDRTRGRKDLVSSCPYGAIVWNDEEQVPQAWPFDAHLLDLGWKQPRGAQACPTGAMRAVRLDDRDMETLATAEKLQVLLAKLGTKPRVYYRNLYRYSAHFLGGTVAGLRDGAEELIEGATVRLLGNNDVVAECLTDGFGDFKFDGLEKGSVYGVEIVSGPWRVRTEDVEIVESRYLGKIPLHSPQPSIKE